MSTTDDKDSIDCPTWCEGCESVPLPGPVETVRSHRRHPLHVTTVMGGPVVAVALSRVDDVTSGLRGETTIALSPGDGVPPRTVSPEQARALSDALDYASRVTARDNNAECAACHRPWPTDGLRDGMCPTCHRAHFRPRLVGAPGLRVKAEYKPPTDEGNWLNRAHVLARYGDRSTCVEVMHYPATGPVDPATDLVRLRLVGHGYLSAKGARDLAALLAQAAADLDARDTTAST